jgi:hypothetical protein
MVDSALTESLAVGLVAIVAGGYFAVQYRELAEHAQAVIREQYGWEIPLWRYLVWNIASGVTLMVVGVAVLLGYITFG